MDTNNNNHKIIQSADTPVSLNQQLVDVDGDNILASYDKNDQCPLNVVETEPIITSIADDTVQDAHQMNDTIDSKTDVMMESMEHETIYNTPENATTTLSGAATDTKNHDENRNHITSDNDMESEDAISESLSTTRQNEYINHGLATWERNREKWLQRNTTIPTNGNTVHNSSNNNNNNNNHTTNHNNNNDNKSLSHKHAKPINVDEIIDALFTSHKKLLLLTVNNISPAATSTNPNTNTSTTNNNMSDTTTIPFPHAVPLPQLVDILQDLWEAEST